MVRAMNASDRLEECLIRVADAARDVVEVAKYPTGRDVEVPREEFEVLAEEITAWVEATEAFLAEAGGVR
jgi:hypothetical protein